jgi:hypothetical protein|tara:strand:+ start:5154 stop:5384 length:231 start_codon:yes stop_codon:yes gene_type:complete
MQKLINVLAVTSFAVSAGLVAGGYYLYENKDRLIDEVKVQITEAAIDGVSEALPGLMGGSAEVPEAEVPATLPLPL